MPSLIWIGSGCAPEPDVEPETRAEPTEVVEAGVQLEAGPGPRPFLPDQYRRATRPESFPHEAHGGIDCSVCHEAVSGHGSHGELGCVDCHGAATTSPVAEVAPEDCQACHHGVEQAVECAGCHAEPGALLSDQLVRLTVWEGARPRSLSFEHSRHADLGCRECHGSDPEAAAAPCASCHAEHHTVDSRCAACHEPAPEGAHDAGVHVTCGGAGCHSEPLIEEISETRQVCLSCHAAQEDHEQDGDCTECHALREPNAWRPPPIEPTSWLSTRPARWNRR